MGLLQAATASPGVCLFLGGERVRERDVRLESNLESAEAVFKVLLLASLQSLCHAAGMG